MKTALPPKSHSDISRNIAAYPHFLLTVCLTFTGCLLAATSDKAINPPPFVSWIPDQRIKSGGFATQYFRILNYDAPGVTISTMVQSTNTAYPASNVTVSSCGSSE